MTHDEERQRRVAELAEQGAAELAEKVLYLQGQVFDALVAPPDEPAERRARLARISCRMTEVRHG